MSDRAQFTTPAAVRWLVTGAIALLVLALVIEEALSAPALAAGGVEQVCGLCHVEPWQVAALLLVLGVHAVIIREYWLTRSGGDDE